MNYIKITPYDIANGPGVRVVFWLAGCEHHCPYCHNPETWDRETGKPVTEAVIRELVEKVNSSHVQGITFSGGDPLAEYNRRGVLEVIRRLKEECPGKDIWIYSGYVYEDLIRDETASEILSLADVLVDGPFVMARYSIMLKWRGSENQRVIDLQETKRTGEVVLYCS